jgi:aminoglycoside 6'-N-acetyltransferase-1b
MMDDDIVLFHTWLTRRHVVEWWGAEDGRMALADMRARYLPRVLAEEGVTPYIAMLGERPIAYAQSYVALGSGDGWWTSETDPGVRGIDQFLSDEADLGHGLGTRLVKCLVDRLFDDPRVTRIQTDPHPGNLRAIRCYEKAGFHRVDTIVTPDGPAVYMIQERPVNVMSTGASRT